MLIEYVNELNEKLTNDPTNRINTFNPKVNNGVISLYKLMDNYSKLEKKKEIPIPDHIKFKKRGERSNTTFIFDKGINQDSIESVIDSTGADNVDVEVDDDGKIYIDIEN
jgi:heterodisulfide reductase subunit B